MGAYAVSKSALDLDPCHGLGICHVQHSRQCHCSGVVPVELPLRLRTRPWRIRGWKKGHLCTGWERSSKWQPRAYLSLRMNG
jgi:hypothetical protein